MLLLTALGAQAAELKLAAVFSDHMVLQREKPVAVWGWAEAGASVTVEFAGQKKTAIADANGKWLVKLDPLEACLESRDLIVTAENQQSKIGNLKLSDVLVGEVWLGAGQSNMEMAVAGANNFAAEKAAANFPLIRQYRESSGPAEKPQAEGQGLWQVCTPATVGRFSATLYFFGREIHREVGVPVGLLNSSVGATHIESWVSAEAQSSDLETKVEYDAQLKGYDSFDEAKATALYRAQVAAWKLATEKSKAGKQALSGKPYDIVAARKRKGPPAGLYNGKIINLAPFTLRGVLWYQGESNAGNPGLYRKQLSQLVTSWRTLWSDELPFAWVQLPNFTAPGEGWPRIREAMMKTLELPKTGMAITIDIGDIKNIHPTNKQEVGRRLSLWALGTVYGRKVPAISGPLSVGHEIRGNEISVAFTHTEGGLIATDGEVKGFAVAGEDKEWKPAQAKIAGDRVIVSGAAVARPVAVRYAWADNPVCNLYNGAGLPASPFRTDSWPVAGAGK